MNPRIALPLAVFVGLGALEVRSGVERLAALRQERRRELLESIDREQEALLATLEDLLGAGSLHATHLARTHAVREFLRGPSAEGRLELRRLLLPYLRSFAEIDRITLLDGDAVEVFRCERMGTGVAALPEELLEPGPQPDALALATSRPAGQVAVSPLLYDATRVEATEEDRRIFSYATSVRAAGDSTGALSVTVYAAPLLHALSAFEPLPGVESWLFDATGRVFAPSADADADADGEWRLALDEATRRRLLDGTPRLEDDSRVLLARSTGMAPASHLVSRIPAEALRAAAGARSGDAFRAGTRTLLVLGAMALVGAWFVRASQRAERLRETERFLARLRAEAEKQRALMEAAADMILIVEAHGLRLRDSNPRAREALPLEGRPEEAFERLGTALEADGAARLRRGIEGAAECGGAAVPVPGLRLRASGGASLELDARCVGIAYGDERLVEICLTDRTRERAMERRVRTAERMGSLGLLTAGVAHEINNPLEGIANYVSLLERSPADEADRARYLARIRAGFEQIRDIVGELLTFARSGAEEGEADLGVVVERAVSMARWSHDLRDVTVRVTGLDEPLRVPGSAGRLEQVVLNLLLNAGRAMEGSGTIRVVATQEDPDRAELVVEDEGGGIDEAELERIFDPFYTRTGGTGLGLAVSYGIVQGHGGELSAENLPGGAGARLRVRLPRAEEKDDRRTDGAHGLG